MSSPIPETAAPETVAVFLPPDLADLALITVQEAIKDTLDQQEYALNEKHKKILDNSQFNFLVSYFNRRNGQLLRLKNLITTGIDNRRKTGSSKDGN